MGKELQQMVDDEVQGRDDARDAAIRADRRANELAVQADEQRVALEAAERARKAAEAKAAEDKAARAMAEVARMITELNNATEGTGNAEKSRAVLSKQVADLQVKLEESETGGGRGVKAQIRKLEQRIMELESDLDTEARKSADVL